MRDARVYLPRTPDQVHDVATHGRLASRPLVAFAVTRRLRGQHPGEDDEGPGPGEVVDGGLGLGPLERHPGAVTVVDVDDELTGAERERAAASAGAHLQRCRPVATAPARGL